MIALGFLIAPAVAIYASTFPGGGGTVSINGVSAGSNWLDLYNNSNTSFLLHNGASGNNLEFAANNSGSVTWQILNLTKTGNVGIGTSSPNSKLQVKGNGGVMSIEGSDHSYIQFYPDGYSSGRKAWLGYGSASDNWITLSSEGNGGIVLNPGSHFVAVEGTLKAKQIQVKTNIWADYVFEDDYNLMSLNEVENFIDENNHLPNIPSQEEVLSQGIDVGEMQRLQMEKIEELTLYILQLDERVNKLENENNTLKNI